MQCVIHVGPIRSPFFAGLIAVTISATAGHASDFTWEMPPVSSNWENPNNWAGPNLQIPDDNTDRAFILGDSPGALDPYLTSNRTIGELSIQDGGNLSNGDGTANFVLTVQNNGGLSGQTALQGIGSDLFIFQSPGAADFDTDILSIGDRANVSLYDGARVQVDDSFELNVAGSVGGNGILELASVASRNDGSISAGGQGTLIVRSAGAGSLDPDGTSGNGSLAAFYNAMLHIQLPLSDSTMNGTMTIDSNAEIRLDQAWTLGATGNSQLNFNGHVGAGATSVATLSGAAATLSGTVNVNGGTGVLAAPTVVTDSATFTIHEGATVQFDAHTTFNDPNTIVNQFNTTWVVNDTVDVGQGAGNFNWDGLGQNGNVAAETIVNPRGTLRIQVASLDEPGLDEVVSADMTMVGGDIYIANADDRWEMAGTLTMHNPDGVSPPLLAGFGAGGGGIEVVISGDLNVTGDGTSGLQMRSVFGGSSQVHVDAGAQLVIGGILPGTNTVIDGGDWTGSGLVSLDADLATVSTLTVVNMPNGTFDIDGEFSGDSVVLNAPLTLNVSSLERIPGEVVHDPLQINSAGRLDVQFGNPNQVYTIADHLELNALGGALASLQLAGARVRLAGTVDVSGNSMAAAPVEISGVMNIAAGGTFQIRGGTETSPSVVRAGADIVGLGSLVVSASGPGYLRLDDNADVVASLINNGHLEVGSSPGYASVRSFTQSAAGVLEVEIDGLLPATQYDQLSTETVANLDGTLEVLVNSNGGTYADPSVPGTLDEFTLLLNSALNIHGTFDDFLYDGASLTLSFSGDGQDRFHVGAGLFRILDYDPGEVDLLNYKALPGDANGDGFVDGSDFGLWNANKFTCGTDWTTGDFSGDGCTDGTDFGIWNANKFTDIDLGRPDQEWGHSQPLQTVPEPLALPFYSLALFAMWFCRTRGLICAIAPARRLR